MTPEARAPVRYGRTSSTARRNRPAGPHPLGDRRHRRGARRRVPPTAALLLPPCRVPRWKRASCSSSPPVPPRRHPEPRLLNLYGPGGIWVLAGIYKLFGTQVVVERVVGLLQLGAPPPRGAADPLVGTVGGADGGHAQCAVRAPRGRSHRDPVVGGCRARARRPRCARRRAPPGAAPPPSACDLGGGRRSALGGVAAAGSTSRRAVLGAAVLLCVPSARWCSGS